MDLHWKKCGRIILLVYRRNCYQITATLHHPEEIKKKKNNNNNNKYNNNNNKEKCGFF